MDQESKKLKEIKEDSDAVFSEIFGFSKKKESEPEVNPNSVIKKISVGRYRLGAGGVLMGIQGPSDAQIMNFDWENSALSWLLDCEYVGFLNVDLRKETVESFGGVWRSGTFKGLAFVNHTDASFEGGEFGDGIVKPRYLPPYTTWKISPMDFVDGTIEKETGGILGIPDAPNGPIVKPFNILSLKPGKSISITVRSKNPIRGAGGKMQKAAPEAVHTVLLEKRINNINSDFRFIITNGDTGKSETKTIPWSEFRKAGEESLMFSPGKTTSFFGINLSDKSYTAEVTDYGKDKLVHSPEEEEKIEQKLALTQQSFDLSKLPYLKISKLSGRLPVKGKDGKLQASETPNAYFYIPTSDFMTKFNQIKKYVDSGKLQADMSILASGIKSGMIKGYGQFQRLAPLFNNVEGTINQEYQAPIQRLDEFIKYFVERIYKPGNNGVVDNETQQLIISKLKQSLGVDSYIKGQAQAPSVPGAAPVVPAKRTKKINPAQAKTIKESVLNSIKNIISDKLK